MPSQSQIEESTAPGSTAASESQDGAPHLSVVMVSYNTKGLTLKALETLYAATRAISFETILVDNASTDGSADAIAAAFPMVKLIRNDDNLGFARANNLAAKHAKGEWLLLLNPDTETFDGSIERLVTFAEAHPKAGIYGGRTVFPDGSLNINSCWNRPTPWSVLCRALGLTVLFGANPIFNTEQIGAWRRDSVRHVDIVVGCFLLIRKALWEELGGFDTTFWMYGEDADLCLRARALGCRPIITPEAVIMHLVGASSGTRADREVLLYNSYRMLIERHWSPALRPVGTLLLTLAAWTRMAGSGLLAQLSPKRFNDMARYWREVWERRDRWQGV